MKRNRTGLLGLLISAALLSLVWTTAAIAGDGDDAWPEDDPKEGVCTQKSFDACGGELEGSWEILDGCMSRMPGMGRMSSCDGAENEFKMLMTGEMVFNKDVTSKMSGRMRHRVELDFPCSCIPKKQRKRAMKNFEVDDGRCKDVKSRSNEDTDKGFYKVEGNKLYIGRDKEDLEKTDRPYGGPEEFDFCVEGDKAWLKAEGGRGPGGKRPDRVLYLKRK
jgi:hypothetical protein